MVNIFENAVKEHPHFVFASVNGLGKKQLRSYFQYAIYIKVPKHICMQRVRDRSSQRFGNRILPGGDLYEKEEAFFSMVSNRSECDIENWLQRLRCPIIQIDGTKSVNENIRLITSQMTSYKEAGHEA